MLFLRNSPVMKVIPVLFILFTMHSCHTGDPDNTEAAIAAIHQEEIRVPVSLDEGKKWKVNPEITDAIQKMSVLLAEGMQTGTAPQMLAAPLQEQYESIFKNCTVTGEAHEQLHHFLMPIGEYLKMIDQPGASAETLHSLEDHLLDYPAYFE